MFTKDSSNVAKGFGVALLLFHHLFYNADRVAAGGEYFALLPYPIVQCLALCARVCVYIFVFVSSYGLSIQFESSDFCCPLRFIIKHCISLMQSFWPVFLFVLFAHPQFASNLNPLSAYEGDGSAGLSLLLDFFGWSDLFGTRLALSAWWYMCFAQLLVVLIPLFAWVCHRFRWYSLPLIVAVTFSVPCNIVSPYGGNYFMYLFVACVGVLFAQNQSFGRMYPVWEGMHTRTRAIASVALAVFALAILLLNQKLSNNLGSWQISGILNGITAAVVCFFSGQVAIQSAFGRAVAFCGRYSGTMFMFHPFLYSYTPFLIYWPREALLCYILFFLLSLLFAVVVHTVRRICKYDALFAKIRFAIDTHIHI